MDSRRAKVKRLLIEGITHGEIAKVLKVNEKTIRRDIETIKDELMKDYKKSFTTILTEFALRTENVYRELNERYKDAVSQGDNKSAIKSLKVLLDQLQQKVTILQSLGVTPKAPEQLVTKVEVSWKGSK